MIQLSEGDFCLVFFDKQVTDPIWPHEGMSLCACPRNWWGAFRGYVNVPETCTHGGCYAADGVRWGDVNLPWTCTHGGCMWMLRGGKLTYCFESSKLPLVVCVAAQSSMSPTMLNKNRMLRLANNRIPARALFSHKRYKRLLSTVSSCFFFSEPLNYQSPITQGRNRWLECRRKLWWNFKSSGNECNLAKHAPKPLQSCKTCPKTTSKVQHFHNGLTFYIKPRTHSWTRPASGEAVWSIATDFQCKAPLKESQ